ncbi:type III secretion inner membrane ring lipoprotein SctJ [Rhizobium sp. LC145]|uniref:type III secretion system inner membrane ring lipoprotein SctJ n=1 Tax=Rhizobium sp. LC145 TaxID=1120688 RepID=UPI0009E4FF97|nr:type III secretion inner membrane ring lipoprotein SctJ [Rhizobium sp. LC145]TKT67107.1 EscJ/YscJ/HrcJ family type III secretion inner membrane ring protein [Rhizobiaceae bacterium LC148]
MNARISGLTTSLAAPLVLAPLRKLAGAALILCALVLSGCQEDLYTNLAEREANSMIATLQRNGIPASRMLQEDGRMKVVVDRDRFSEAVRVLEDAGLPKQAFATMGEVFQQEGLVASPMQERAKMLYALSEELSKTVSEIDGVLSARIHIVLPDNDPLRREASPSSASVFIRHESGLKIDPLIPQIKTLVANGIAGLSYDKVSVVPVAAPVTQPASATQPMVAFLGLWMLETSVSRAMWIIGGLAFLVVALAGALAAVIWRQRGHRTYELESYR